MWEVITDHARTCMIDEGLYLYYYPSSQQKTGVVFNVVGQVKGLVRESLYFPTDLLSEKEKACHSFPYKFSFFFLTRLVISKLSKLI